MAIPSLTGMQAFIDFTHSNIYSVNKNASDYHIVGTHIQACILGSKLEALDYYKAALRALHKVLEPLARSAQSRAVESPIRPADIEQVCLHAHEIPTLCDILYHAVATHWTLDEILFIAGLYPKPLAIARIEGYTKIMNSPLVQAWSRVWNQYTHFRKFLISITKREMYSRSMLFRPVEYYIKGRTFLIERRIEHARHRDEAHRNSGKWTQTLVLGRRQRSDSDGDRIHGDTSRRRVCSPSCDGSSNSNLSDLNGRIRNSGLSGYNSQRDDRDSGPTTEARNEIPPLRNTIHEWLRGSSSATRPESPTQVYEALPSLSITSDSQRKGSASDDGWEIVHKDDTGNKDSVLSLD